MVPSVGIVGFVVETGKCVPVGPGAMWEAETWSRCIFSMCEDLGGLFLDRVTM